MGFLSALFGNSSKTLENYITQGAVILDVRTASEYQNNHITSAKHIPLQDLNKRYKEIEKLNKPVVVHCASGMRSANAASFLKSKGIDAINGGGIAKVAAALK